MAPHCYLLSLPSELLLLFIKHLMPEDLVNFALSCKSIYAVADSSLKQHQKWLTTYRYVMLHGCHRHGDDHDSAQLLRDLCVDPKIAHYPEALTIECCDPREPTSDFDDSEGWDYLDYNGLDFDEDEFQGIPAPEDTVIADRLTKDIQDKIASLASQTQLEHGPHFENLLERIRSGNRALIMGFLLCLLPNIRCITIVQYAPRRNQRKHSLQKMIHALNDHNYAMSPKYLPNLSEVRFCGGEAGEDDELEREDTIDFRMIKSFAAIESVRKICAERVIVDEEYPGNYADGPSSSATEINFQRCDIESTVLGQLLRDIDGLKRFIYDHIELESREARREVRDLISILFDHNRHSLEYVALTGGTVSADGSDPYLEIERWIDNPLRISFQDFQFLRFLRLDARVWFYEGDIHMGPLNDYSDETYKRCRIDPVLIDLLPLSIETVELDQMPSVVNFQAMFADFKSQREGCVPNLKTIIIRWRCSDSTGLRSNTVRPVQAMCSLVGVYLDA